jgi:hypothetical protein
MPEQGTPDVLTERLDLIIRLLASLVAAQHENLKDRALALSVLGLPPTVIARVCNTTSNTISVRLAEARRSSRSTTTPRRKSGKRKGAKK